MNALLTFADLTVVALMVTAVFTLVVGIALGIVIGRWSK